MSFSQGFSFVSEVIAKVHFSNNNPSILAFSRFTAKVEWKVMSDEWGLGTQELSDKSSSVPHFPIAFLIAHHFPLSTFHFPLLLTSFPAP
jgi:hypothetical protein